MLTNKIVSKKETFQGKGGGGGRGVSCRFWGDFGDCLLPGGLGKNAAVAFKLGQKCCCQFSLNFCDTQFGIKAELF